MKFIYVVVENDSDELPPEEEIMKEILQTIHRNKLVKSTDESTCKLTLQQYLPSDGIHTFFKISVVDFKKRVTIETA